MTLADKITADPRDLTCSELVQLSQASGLSLAEVAQHLLDSDAEVLARLVDVA